MDADRDQPPKDENPQPENKTGGSSDCSNDDEASSVSNRWVLVDENGERTLIENVKANQDGDNDMPEGSKVSKECKNAADGSPGTHDQAKVEGPQPQPATPENVNTSDMTSESDSPASQPSDIGFQFYKQFMKSLLLRKNNDECSSTLTRDNALPTGSGGDGHPKTPEENSATGSAIRAEPKVESSSQVPKVKLFQTPPKVLDTGRIDSSSITVGQHTAGLDNNASSSNQAPSKPQVVVSGKRNFKVWYEKDACSQIIEGFGRLFVGDGEEFIEGIWKKGQLVQLHQCQLTRKPGNQLVIVVKRQRDYLLSVYEDEYIARADNSISFEELDFTAPVAGLKAAIFKKLEILNIVVDKLTHKRQDSLGLFVQILKATVGRDADVMCRANTLALLGKCSKDPTEILSAIQRDKTVPVDLQTAASNLLDNENRYLNNAFSFSAPLKVLPSLDLREVLSSIRNEAIELHRRVLLQKCPQVFPLLLATIQSCPKYKVLYITVDDIGVFDHLMSQPCFEHPKYKEFCFDLVERFGHAIHDIKYRAPPQEVIPLMSPVYGFLMKSFWDVGSEISQMLNNNYHEAAIKCEFENWCLNDIDWPRSDSKQGSKRSKRKLSLHQKSLDAQYKFLFDMMIYFSPESFLWKKKFEYEFRVLEKGALCKDLGVLIETGSDKKLEDLPDERLPWLYLLDHTVYEVFNNDRLSLQMLKLYHPLFKGHINYIVGSPANSHESFRILTHRILQFVISTAAHFTSSNKHTSDVELLIQRWWDLESKPGENQGDERNFSYFSDLISEFNRYLRLRLSISVEVTSGYFAAQISQIMQKFISIVVDSLKKSVSITSLVLYFRALNEFLDDFKNIDFWASWFVKSSFDHPDFLEKVDNKLKSGGHCSYRVTNIDEYVKILEKENQPVPDHYLICIVSKLFEYVGVCLNKNWVSSDEKLDEVQMECTGVLLDAIRRSFMYLKEQPDYVDFESFKKESVDPFERVVNHCTTLSGFKKRTAIVKESFWYIRKMDEIGIEQALQLLKNINSCDSNTLLKSYHKYLAKYNHYLTNYCSLLAGGRSHSECLKEVSRMIGDSAPLHFSAWTKNIKVNQIPLTLAGLSAIWSILVSKDVSSTGKFLKPHCIQILCIMRLLSVDDEHEITNHLAQVLTGQGKSVILGLLSSTLALYGHKVRVVCYNEYLSSRDESDFAEFFEIFGVEDKITYGTFDDMADVFLNPATDEGKTSLRELIKRRVRDREDWAAVGRVKTETRNTVLLIDEVDVFFSPKFYGDSYHSCVCLPVEGLASVQEYIWDLVRNPSHVASEIFESVEKYIQEKTRLCELRAFQNKPGTFSLLTYHSNQCIVKTYTNRSLLDEHLRKMIKQAKDVFDESDKSNDMFKINNESIICLKNRYGIYEAYTYGGYKNTFQYFKLKGSNFDTKQFKNYGYLLLDTGRISYARLPSSFSLILGVSGTVTNLDGYQKSAIASYNINTFSILPSFYGESNLVFEENANFACVNQQLEWLKMIFDAGNRILESLRAVIIFFESEAKLKLFTNEYGNKFDRLNVITENTEESDRDTLINEAGISCTVTLATREMGRGVDYKSSLAVEKNGGVHVIQTFYSDDVKEEIQIKGRTARKDNKGSFELIVCREHLVENKIIQPGDVKSYNYFSLDAIRWKLMDEKEEEIAKNIERAEKDHKVTMEFFGLS